ncbi:DUF4304 domain-containing protein [Sorangium sp. So ce429]
MSRLDDILTLLRLGTLREARREDGRARLTVAIPGGQVVTLVLDGCTDLHLDPSAGPLDRVSDPAALTALELQLLDRSMEPSGCTFVWARTQRRGAPVRGGRLVVRAANVALLDEGGAPTGYEAFVARVAAATTARTQSFSVADYRKAFDGALRREVRPFLATAGFSAERRTFLRARPGLIDVISFEQGRWASAESTSFTMRIRPFVGELQPGDKLDEKTVLVRTASALTRTFEPDYILAGRVDEEALAAGLRDDLALVVLPFFDTLRNTDEVIAFLDAEDRRRGDHFHAFMAANILVRLGRLEEAHAHFLVSEGDRDAIRRFAASFGITL